MFAATFFSMCQTDRLLDAGEVAAILGKTRSWVEEEARCRRIPVTMPGRSYRWTLAQVGEIIAAFAVVPGTGTPPRAPGRRRKAPPEPAEDAVPMLHGRTPRRLLAATAVSQPAA
jgi:predicted DNA-binding transcriptional regulator AlpA